MACDSNKVIGPRHIINAAYIEEYPWLLIKWEIFVFHILKRQI